MPLPADHNTAPAPLLRRIVLVREGELRALLWSAAYFFFLLASYYVMRPVRESLGIDRGADKLPWLMTGTLIAMVLVNPVFAALVARVPRRVFIPWTYRFFALNMLGFVGLAALASDSPWVGYAFYIWLSVFNLFAVSVFWAFMADGFNSEQGKRLFGFIGAGGTLGAIAGASLTASFVKDLGAFGMLIVAAALLELAVQCFRRLAPALGGAGNRAAEAHPEPGPGVWAGLTLVARSRYLMLISIYLFIFATLSTFLYLQQGQIIGAALPDREARAALFARIDIAVNTLTVLTQVFLTGRLIRGLGLSFTLALLPAISIVGFGALWAAPHVGLPLLATLLIFQATRRGLNFAIAQPSRQILFTAVTQDERYKSKPFIDTAVYRGGDMFGAWFPTAASSLLGRLAIPAAAVVPGAAIPLAFASLVIGVSLGRMQQRRVARAGAAQEVRPKPLTPALEPAAAR